MNRIDLMGKKVGKLTVIEYLPPDKRTSGKYSGAVWLCQCDCGNTVEVRGTYLSGNGNYTQKSCGCDRLLQHFLATISIETSEAFLTSFPDFEKVRFIHQALMRTSGLKMSELSVEDFEKFITYFYYDNQFNKVYQFWKENIILNTSFYDYAKPSLDHKIPKSRNGTNELDNLHFITVLENLAKRDMTWDEWITFKKITNTASDYFLDSILAKGDKDNE